MYLTSTVTLEKVRLSDFTVVLTYKIFLNPINTRHFSAAQYSIHTVPSFAV